jgi:hypothetical protein
MKRSGSTSEASGFRAEACWVLHFMNAWEEANRSIVDVLQCEQPPRFSHLLVRRPTSTSRMPGRPRMCDFFSLRLPFLLVRSAQCPPGKGAFEEGGYCEFGKRRLNFDQGGRNAGVLPE